MNKKAEQARKTIDPSTLAGQLGLSTNGVYSALQSGTIPGAVRVGRRWLIPADAADRLLAGGSTIGEQRHV